jgi:hypothetical protein
VNLNFGMTLPQLSTPDGLTVLDQRFLEELGFVSPELLKQLQQGRQQPHELTPLQESTLKVALGPYVENFIAKLFKIEARLAGLRMARREPAPSFATQAGCSPEFHGLKASGHVIAALAMVAVDNPMVAANGRRNRDGCLKSTRAAANLAEIETCGLKDVLELPYAFEICSLLARWNPLDLRPGGMDRRVTRIASGTMRGAMTAGLVKKRRRGRQASQ